MRPLVPALALAVAALALGGCKSTDDAVNQAAASVTTAAPRAGEAAELGLLRGQIDLYRQMHAGKAPPSLEAMPTLPRLTYGDDYVYDPATGEVHSKRFPGL